MASPSQLEREKEGTPRVKSTSWSSSRVLLAYWSRRGGGGRPHPENGGRGWGGVLARRTHAAPHRRQAFAV